MTVTARSIRNYQVEITSGNHTLISDEPAGVGDDMGPGPFDLVLAGLASCTIITLQMYANRKNWPLQGIEMRLEMRSIETVSPDGTKSRSSAIDTWLKFEGELSKEQMDRLHDIASRCPVHRTLTGDIAINTQVIQHNNI